MKARLREKKKIASDVYQFSFDLLGKEMSFLPGQFIVLNLKNPPYKDSRGTWRYFSIINYPKDTGIFSLATRKGISAFKKSLWGMDIGTEVEAGPIMGDFILPKKNAKIVMIAGGIGITPLICMLRDLSEKNEKDYYIDFIYSNNKQTSTPFKEELEKYSDNGLIRLTETFTDDLDWKGESSRVDKDFIAKYVDNYIDKFFMISGPPSMVKGVFSEIVSLGVSKKNILTDELIGY